ncbi:hypothetical protein TW95_gp0141 [Pandoravirus inopinatum]|uniref:Uncharacterized protein n=1 Tax=Pandoravirus inopinatum TaxID=1605721 RepID=A0A0B5J5E7_9VIRU|nr:hypothetical protein TW95_gp0141 [Pandoravirus inopinatum]AJF96875.1 hypothetical protein [Pandoravirus inopinatum]
MIGEAWRRRVVVLLVLLGAAAAAAILCAAGILLHRHATVDMVHDDDAVEAPPAAGSGCPSLVHAHRCKARCGCEWCPPGPGFGCHEAASGRRPCGGHNGHRRAFWTCETHLATWLAVGGAGLVGAVFVAAAASLWACWPSMCRPRSTSVDHTTGLLMPLDASASVNA